MRGKIQQKWASFKVTLYMLELQERLSVVAHSCHVVWACFRGKKKKRLNSAKLAVWHVFMWPPFSLPCENTTNRRIKHDTKIRHVYTIDLSALVLCGGAKTRQMANVVPFPVVIFAFSPRKHANTAWHKSATITVCFLFMKSTLQIWLTNINYLNLVIQSSQTSKFSIDEKTAKTCSEHLISI